jgi:hypothetical protein
MAFPTGRPGEKKSLKGLQKIAQKVAQPIFCYKHCLMAFSERFIQLSKIANVFNKSPKWRIFTQSARKKLSPKLAKNAKSGTDVKIFKIFSPKKSAKNWRF